MELDYKNIYGNAVLELNKRTEEFLIYKTLSDQLQEKVKQLQDIITDKDLEIAKLSKELENKELLNSNE